MLSAHQAHAVAGPVYPKFESKQVPAWVLKGGFFEPPSHPAGTSLDAAFTNNVLVSADCLRELDTVFDARFAIKGSEDTHLFMRLRKLGAKIVWADAAIVYESVPSSRTSFAWLRSRAYWGWSSFSLFEKEIYPSFKIQLLRFLKGCVLIVYGVLCIIPSVFIGKHQLYKSILNFYKGVGTLSGLFGIMGSW